MTLAIATRATARPIHPTPTTCRLALVLLASVALLAGVLATGEAAMSRAVAVAGADLTRLLRFMALLKGLMAAVVLAAILWRLAVPITFRRFAAYALASAAMAAGPGLIWGMVHIALGAALLHGGLFSATLLIWFDPAAAQLLESLIKTRRTTGYADPGLR